MHAWIRERIDQLGLNQAQVGAATGLGDKKVSQIISGKRGIQLLEAYKMAEILLMPLEDFVLKIEEIPNPKPNHQIDFRYLDERAMIASIKQSFRKMEPPITAENDYAERFYRILETAYEARVTPTEPDDSAALTQVNSD